MLNFLAWLVLIYVVLMLFWRYVLPLLLRLWLRRVEKRYGQTTTRRDYNNKKEGEVSIHAMPETQTRPSAPPSDVEYTDFEEVRGGDPEERKDRT